LVPYEMQIMGPGWQNNPVELGSAIQSRHGYGGESRCSGAPAGRNAQDEAA
jgi:hypothetical protein